GTRVDSSSTTYVEVTRVRRSRASRRSSRLASRWWRSLRSASAANAPLSTKTGLTACARRRGARPASLVEDAQHELARHLDLARELPRDRERWRRELRRPPEEPEHQ